jgi:hypothetical protein
MDKKKYQVVIDLDSCADFYDFCVENDIEFVVNGMKFDDAKDEKAVMQKLQDEMTKLINLLLFKRKIRDLLQIITRDKNINVSLPEAKELLTNFFIEFRQQSADLLTSLMPIPATPKTPSGNTKEC